MRETPSSSKKYSVFEFNNEDERIENESHKILSKFKKRGKPQSDVSPLNKYSFLQCFAQGTMAQLEDFQTLDVDAADDDMKQRISGLDEIEPSCSSNFKPMAHSYPDYLDSEYFVCGTNSTSRTSNYGLTSADHKRSKIEPVCVDSDDDSIELTSSSAFVGTKGPLDKPTAKLGCTCETAAAVVVIPDYVIYGDMYSNKSQLTFYCGFIKLVGSAGCGIEKPLSFEWGISDIVNIEAHWCESVKTATLDFHLKSKDTEVAKNIDKVSGVDVLSVAVFEPLWSEKKEEIKSLDARYKALWIDVSGTNTARTNDAFFRQSNMLFSKNFFPNFVESFEEVIYPKGDPDAVSISERDIDLLQPENFVNDTIIDFYIKYLNNKLSPEKKQRFHFFNSFFFRKLADLDKDPSRACGGRETFQRVRKWTRRVDIFKKDYVFIPVNFSLHWSLIVLCHPGDVASFNDQEIEPSRVPCILHMNSIRGSHRGLKNLIQSYLWEEWKERHNEPAEDISSSFLNLRFIPLELPQQENSFDCGLFLLHYVELFVKQAPVNFSPFRITNSSNFLSKGWFPPAEAFFKRSHIKKLIYEIIENDSQKVSPANCDEEVSESLDVNEGETTIEQLCRTCNSMEICPENCSNSSGDQEIENAALGGTPKTVKPQFGESKSVCRIMLEPECSVGTLIDKNYHRFEHIRFKNVMSPIEESGTSGEQTAGSSLDKSISTDRKPKPFAFSYSTDELETIKTEPSPSNEKDHSFEKILVFDSEDEKDDPNGKNHFLSEKFLVLDSEEEKEEEPNNELENILVVEDSEEEENESKMSPFRRKRVVDIDSSNKHDKAYGVAPVLVLGHEVAKRPKNCI